MNQFTRSNQIVTSVLGCLALFVAAMLNNDHCVAQSNRYSPPQEPTLANPAAAPTSQPPLQQQPTVPGASGQPAPTATPSTVQQSVAIADLTNGLPVVMKAEAFAGLPYGVGKVTFRLSSSDAMLDRTGAILIDDAQQRILYPVVANSAFKAFMESIVGKQSSEPTDVHTVWFLFQGEAPLTISVFGSQQETVVVPVEFVRPRQFDRRVKQWWQSFNRVVDCLLYTSPSPRDQRGSRMPSSA